MGKYYIVHLPEFTLGAGGFGGLGSNLRFIVNRNKGEMSKNYP